MLYADRLWVGSTLGDSTNCGTGADLTGGADGLGPTWPANTMRTITVRVSASGVPSIFIDGVPAVAPPAAAYGDQDAPNCRPPVVAPTAALIFGSSGNMHYDDKFHGVMSNIEFSFSG